jgi:4-hydroxy-tetrahydrodipicolinate synthase
MKQLGQLKGVFPAIILPLNQDYSIDEGGLRRHVQRVANVSGVNGIVCNAHASEVTLLTREERKRVLRIVLEEVRDKVPVIAGAYGESTAQIIESASDAKEAGADAVLIMPPFSFNWGATQYPDVIFNHFSAIDRAVDMPFIVFQYAHWTNCNYDPQTLLKISEIRNCVAIKNAVNDPRRYEEEYTALKAARPGLSFLNANDIQMLSYFCIGSDGALVGYACLTPELIVDLYQATEKGDLHRARKINSLMYPLTQAIYSHPRLNWHTRIKEALVMMGEIKCAAARPFLPEIGAKEREEIRNALASCNLLKR